MRNNRWVRGAIGFLAALILSIPVVADEPRYNPANNVDYGKQFQEILDKIRGNHVNPDAVKSEAELFRIAIEAILREVGDNHGAYFDDEQYKALQEDLRPTRYSGIGVRLAPGSGGLVILEIHDNSPLKMMNIRIGDTIFQAGDTGGDKVLWDGKNIKEMVGAIKGPEGTPVDLSVKRSQTNLGTITVNRVTTRKQYIYYDLDQYGILTVRITQFSSTIYDDMMKVLFNADLLHGCSIAPDDEPEQEWLEECKLDTDKVKALVLDLRFNPGGAFGQSVALCDMLLPAGKTCVRQVTPPTEDSEGRPVATDFKTSFPRLFPNTIPRVIMGNEFSASASEIVIGAMLVHKEMEFLGMKTYGKGSVQNILPIAGGGAVKTTSAIYLAGGTMEIDGRGAQPTMQVVQVPVPGMAADHKRINGNIIRTQMDPTLDYQLAVAHAYVRAFIDGGHSMESTQSVQAAKNKAHGAEKPKFDKAFCDTRGLVGCPLSVGFMGHRTTVIIGTQVVQGQGHPTTWPTPPVPNPSSPP